MARAIMLQGTGSDVGKTVLVAGLCRAARNRGMSVRPFKPQNMSNNAAVADLPGETGGGEIGRAQWLQAIACGVAPSIHMNPVLLKPQSETGSQIVVQGKVFGQAKARDYQLLKPRLMEAVLDSWGKVGEGADLVIVEGAGSPAEVNLRPRDIANMGFATRADVPVILVGDIDRGGVIASIAGTHLILSDEDRRMIAGYVINKFRGDVSLFDDGLATIERYTGWRSFGVVPWLHAAALLPSEDSVVLERLASGERRALKVAVPMLSRIANFDDLDPLKAEPQVEVVFVAPGRPLPEDAGLVVIPGSKSTIADLIDFRRNGWDRDLAAHRRRGGHVIGICGGYQMLGRVGARSAGHRRRRRRDGGARTARHRNRHGAREDRAQCQRALGRLRRTAVGLRNPPRPHHRARLPAPVRHHRRRRRRRDLGRRKSVRHLHARPLRRRCLPPEIPRKPRRQERRHRLSRRGRTRSGRTRRAPRKTPRLRRHLRGGAVGVLRP